VRYVPVRLLRGGQAAVPCVHSRGVRVCVRVCVRVRVCAMCACVSVCACVRAHVRSCRGPGATGGADPRHGALRRAAGGGFGCAPAPRLRGRHTGAAAGASRPLRLAGRGAFAGAGAGVCVEGGGARPAWAASQTAQCPALGGPTGCVPACALCIAGAGNSGPRVFPMYRLLWLLRTQSVVAACVHCRNASPLTDAHFGFPPKGFTPCFLVPSAPLLPPMRRCN
jgi:hypothetical protein